MTATAVNRTFGQWRILLVTPGNGASQEITPLISQHLPYSNVFELKDYPTRNDLSAILMEQSPNLCFVDVETNRDFALPFLSDLALLDPKLPAVALHNGNESDFILKTLRSGASEFLIRPITREQFFQSMERITSLHRSSRNGSTAKIYMVAPAKGACGASTIAGTIAFHFRKLGSQKVLLADLDPYAGTISFQLKLKQNFSFMDALLRGSQLDGELWKGIVFPVNGVDVLLAPEQPVHGIDESQDPSPMMEFVRMNYETVVLDAGSVYGRWATTLAHQCDELVLVTTNELSALQAMQRSMSYLDRARVDRGKIRVAVNRFNRDFGLNQEVIEAALHADVTEVIPSDYETVQKSLVDGRPIPPGSNVGKSMMNLASKLSGRELVETPAPKSNGLGSFFGSLFSKR